MTNYLLVCLSSSTRTWLLKLPTGSARSWNQLRRLFSSNFHATCAWLGVDWDLASVVQKKGESLHEYIQRFYNKRNVIPEVDNKSIMMFFKKGLRDSSIIRKITMKTLGRQNRCFPSPIGMPWLRMRPSTQESRRRSWVTQISLAHPRATIRTESRIVLSMRSNDLVVIRSTGPGRVNLKPS
jgi:hypothetical protein